MSTVSDGNKAERAVAEEMMRRGFKVLYQNWKTKFAEIDIVATKGKTLYFVEVKYRKTEYAGDGFEYITDQKLHHMQRAAEAYVLMHDWNGPYELLAAAVTNLDGSFQIDLREVA